MTPVRLGLAGHAFGAYGPQRLFDLMGRLGVHGLDYWPWNRADLSATQLRRLADDKGVRIYSVNVPGVVARVADPQAGPDAFAAIVAAMDEAVTLGADIVQVYSAVPCVDDLQQAAEQLIDSVRPLVAEAARRGLVLTVENNLDQRGEDPHRHNPSRSPEALRLALDGIGSDAFRLCFDPCNFVTVGVEEYPYAYDLLTAYIVNVHVKDCRRYAPDLDSGRPEASKLLVDSIEGPFLPTALGEGAVAWSQLADRLSRDEYSGWITLDPFIADELLETWCAQSVHRLGRLLGGSPEQKSAMTEASSALGERGEIDAR